ncbi:MAG TPA: hypothetical protein VIM30_09640 [Candidatus Limnocylindrales bacterium]
MTAERRLARLEASLSPVQAVLHWLDEAQAFPSLTAYVRSIAAEPLAPTPLDRVLGSVEGGVRAAMKGKPRPEVDAALTRAARQAAFRYLLVMRLNLDTHEAAQLKGLGAAALFFLMRALGSDEIVTAALSGDPDLGGASEADPAPDEGSAWRRWRGSVVGLLSSLYAEEEARLTLEERYLAGHGSLFADVEQEWTEAREQAERVARFALLLQPGENEEPPESLASISLEPFRDDSAAQAALKAGYIADMVRASTLELAGQHGRAASLVARHLLADGPSDGAA